MIEIKNCDINLHDTITCGQCFRFYEESDNSYTLILSDRVINVKQVNDSLFIESNNYDDLENIVKNYFDLNRNYDEINKKLLEIDNTIKDCIENSKGLKILNQEPFEMIISYIISQNNKVSRISNSINYISKKYGKKIIFKGSEYYLFPTFDELKHIDLETLKESKVGFRDKYILSAIKRIEDGKLDIEKIKDMNTSDALNYLELVKGIGPKVASCILLFAYSRLDVFPIDTWVKKAIEYLYDDVPINQKKITEFAYQKYGEYCGLALQYMFHYMRNKI